MNVIFNFVVFTAIALIVGLGSAWHMIERGSALTTLQSGPWSAWYAAGMPDADPYTKAHVARSGTLPIVSTTAMAFVARTDADGEPLESRCHYEVRVPDVPALWWSLAVYDAAGRLVENPVDRHAFNSKTLIAARREGVAISVAPSPRAGYWLPSGEGRNLMLVFRVFRPYDTANLAGGEIPEEILPRIDTVGCA